MPIKSNNYPQQNNPPLMHKIGSTPIDNLNAVIELSVSDSDPKNEPIQLTLTSPPRRTILSTLNFLLK